MSDCRSTLLTVTARLAVAASEIEAEEIGRDLLRPLLITRPECAEVAGEIGRQNPKFASALAHALSPSAAYQLLGRGTLVRAYSEFAQPDVPGWWDSWSLGALQALIQEDAQEGWKALVDLANVAPRDSVLDDLASQFYQDVLERHHVVDLDIVRADLLRFPKVRRAMLKAVRYADPRRSRATCDSLGLAEHPGDA